MFLPDNNFAEEGEERRQACKQVENWALELVPADIREDVQISVQEVQCGDPNCSPVDTAITIIFNSGGHGMMGMPMEVSEVTRAELNESFPTEEVLRKWYRGEDASWPPDDPQEMELRFDVGTRVLCRVGPDPVTGWAPGTVVQLWYREPQWPPNSMAPYKILLEDGRHIFAPGDMEQVIRRNPLG